MTETVKRIALFFTPTTALVNWVTLDQTGQPPRVVEDIWIHRFELVSLDDAPLAIYRADTGGSYERDALAALAELVRVVNGEPNVSVDVDENLRQLREQLRATVDNAETLLGERDATIERAAHQTECIRQEARRWKSKANAKLEVADYWEAEARRLAEIATERDAAASAWEVEATRRRSDGEALLAEIDRLNGVVTEMTAQIVDAQANALRTIDRISSALPITHWTEPEVVTADYTVTEDGSLNANTLRAKDATISRQLDTIRDQADMIDSASEKIEEAARNLSQCSAERAEAWRDLDKLRAERDAALRERDALKGRAQSWERVYYHPALRQFTEEDGVAVDQVMEGISKLAEWRETIREQYVQTVAERDSALRERDEMAVDRDAADTMRMRLDARLGEERDAYIASSTALQSVIRNYDGLAQCGANLARAVTAERPDLGEAGSLGRAYLREMAARFGA